MADSLSELAKKVRIDPNLANRITGSGTLGASYLAPPPTALPALPEILGPEQRRALGSSGKDVPTPSPTPTPKPKPAIVLEEDDPAFVATAKKKEAKGTK
jgi:hypothetical protein